MLLIFAVILCGFIFLYNNKPQIGIYVYDMSDFYMTNYMGHLMEELEGAGDVYVHDAKNSQLLQNEAILQQIDQMDVLAINPVDRLSAYALIKLAESKGKTVIFFNREPLSSDLTTYNRAFYVGSEATQSAKYQAELIAELYGNNPRKLNEVDANGDNRIQLVIFKGQRGHQDAEDRTKYLKIYLTQEGYDMDLVDIKVADWNKYKAKAIMEEMIEDDIYAEVIACNNDYMALGVVEAVEAKTSKFTYHIIGIDGMKEAIEAIKQGKMYGTVFNDAGLQAKAVADIIKNELDGTESAYSDQYIWIDYDRLNKNDMQTN